MVCICLYPVKASRLGFPHLLSLMLYPSVLTTLRPLKALRLGFPHANHTMTGSADSLLELKKFPSSRS